MHFECARSGTSDGRGGLELVKSDADLEGYERASSRIMPTFHLAFLREKQPRLLLGPVAVALAKSLVGVHVLLQQDMVRSLTIDRDPRFGEFEAPSRALGCICSAGAMAPLFLTRPWADMVRHAPLSFKDWEFRGIY
jgi:hypothetical protein